jgi:hypothetical protein
LAFDGSYQAWLISNTERMRLTSTGLGIGTSSPAVPLEVSNASSGIMRITTVSGASQLQFKSSGTNLQYISYNIGGAGALSFYDSHSAAERMRLDSSGNLGIGTSSPNARLELTTDTNNRGIRIYRALGTSGGGYEGILFALNNTASTQIDYAAITVNSTIATAGAEAGAISFKTYGSGALTERLRITSAGNVGIGTSSPVGRLDVDTASNTYLNVFTSNTNSAAVQTFVSGATSDGAAIGYNVAMRFGTATGKNAASFSEKMRLDSSGNLGLGVTPSTGGYGKGFQISQASNNLGTFWTQAISDNDHRVSLTDNAKNTGVGTWAYFGSSQSATMYQQATGQHQWYTAPVGTAGNAISFTQAMTLDASGNLLVGTTSSSGSYSRTLALANGGSVGISFDDQSIPRRFAIGTRFGNLVFDDNTAGQERARIDSSGNLLVGLTSATGVAKLQVSGPIRTTGYTVATLPAGTVGMRTYVTDALAPSFGVTVAGSGAVTIPVFYNGANWIVA